MSSRKESTASAMAAYFNARPRWIRQTAECLLDRLMQRRGRGVARRRRDGDLLRPKLEQPQGDGIAEIDQGRVSGESAFANDASGMSMSIR